MALKIDPPRRFRLQSPERQVVGGSHFVRGLVVIVGTTAACTTTHVVRPLGRGNTALNASLGGPLVELGSVVTPVPILSVGGAYGLRDDLEVFGHADLTAALYGDLHVEPGLAYHPIVRQGGVVPTVTVAGSVQFLTDISDTRAIPQITVAAGWRVGGKHMVYAGADNALAIGSPTRYVFGPLVGGELRIGHIGLALETKWLAPNYDVSPLAPAWLSPANQGYLSMLLGVNYYLGDTP